MVPVAEMLISFSFGIPGWVSMSVMSWEQNLGWHKHELCKGQIKAWFTASLSRMFWRLRISKLGQDLIWGHMKWNVIYWKLFSLPMILELCDHEDFKDDDGTNHSPDASSKLDRLQSGRLSVKASSFLEKRLQVPTCTWFVSVVYHLLKFILNKEANEQ